MRNLHITSDEASCIDIGENVSNLCANPETGTKYIVTDDCSVLQCDDSSFRIDLREEVPDLGQASIVSFSYELEVDSIFLTTTQGHLLLLDTEQQTVEEVGLIEGGIAAASWSPEGELLAIVTNSALLLLFNKGFDVLSEASVLEWPEQVVPSRKLPDNEESNSITRACISWRGDGKYFSTVTLAGSGGILRVWEREGCILHAMGEDAPGLLGPVCWQPNGRHIYAAQQCSGEQRIALFERNGLAHGGFPVRTQGVIDHLAWSADSSLLAVQVSAPKLQAVQLWARSNWRWYLKQELRFGGGSKLCMSWNEEGANQLTMCQARTIRTVGLHSGTDVSSLGTAAVVDGCSLLITPLRHGVVPPPLCAVTATFQAPIQSLAFLGGHRSEAVVALLADGSLGLLECMEEDLWEETLEEQQEDSLRASSVQLEAHTELHDGQHIRCLAWVEREALLVAYTGGTLAELEFRQEGEQPVAWLKGTRNISEGVLAMVGVPGGAVLVQLESGKLLHFSTDGGLTTLQNFPQPCPWMAAVPIPQPGVAAAAVGLSSDGSLYLGSKLVAADVTSAAVRLATLASSPDYLIYTTKDDFIHTRPFLELLGATTSTPTKDKAGDAERLPKHRGLGEGRKENHYPDMHSAMRGHGCSVPSANILKARAVEQGSRIVAAPPDDVRVVLQLPRGNLETIFPRSLVLPAIAAAIEEERYAEAWSLASVHRVDLNLLVDYNWPAFLSQADSFVRQVPDDQDLVDLLAALREDNVVAEGGLYSGLPPPSARSDVVSPGEGKVAAVCSALRASMLASSPDLFLKPLATSHAIQGDPESALLLVKEAKEAQLAREASCGEASTPGGPEEVRMGQGALGLHKKTLQRQAPTAEDALKHLLLTLDVEQLYRACLGMYELELAYMVLAHSQRDPGEYLLELQQFASHPDGPLRHYAINMHLRRTSAALKNLLAAGDDHFEQALVLARKEGKLRELLSLLDVTAEAAEKRKAVLNQYGAWLAEKHKQEDAAVAFLAAGNLEAALVQYREGNHWRMALSVAGRMGLSQESVRELAETFVDSLSESSRLAEAALIATEYLQDGDSAVALLSQAREWREALRVAAMFRRDDLVETTIAPQAADCASSHMEEMEDSKERIHKYTTRLKEVRDRRVAMAAALEEGEDERREFDDTASEGGSSMISGLSAYTRGSEGVASTAASTGQASTVGGRLPQKKQKKNKKGPRIRQGSPQEEEALVAHIASLAPTPQLCNEIGQLAELLVLLGHEMDARRLQTLLSEVQARQKEAQQQAGGTQAADAADWKWDILRPVLL